MKNKNNAQSGSVFISCYFTRLQQPTLQQAVCQQKSSLAS